jgi:hypothetical protein
MQHHFMQDACRITFWGWSAGDQLRQGELGQLGAAYLEIVVTRPRFERAGMALHVACGHGPNHELLPNRSQFAPSFGSW